MGTESNLQSMVIKVYISSQTPSNEIRKQQRQVTDFLQSNGIQHDEIDMSQYPQARRDILDKLRENSAAQAPMIFDEDGEFVGEYLDFFDARKQATHARTGTRTGS